MRQSVKELSCPLSEWPGVSEAVIRRFGAKTPIGLVMALCQQGTAAAPVGVREEMDRLLGAPAWRLSPAAQMMGKATLPASLGLLPPGVLVGASLSTPTRRVVSVSLPKAFNMVRETAPETMRSQGQRGTCVAFSCTAAIEGRGRWIHGHAGLLSPQKFYYELKRTDGHPDSEGSSIEASIQVATAIGSCREATCPYDPEPQTEGPGGPRPPEAAFREAFGLVCPDAALLEVGDIVAIKMALSEGFPVVVGIPVWDNWENAWTHLTGDVPDPPDSRSGLLGYHAVPIVGYDDATERFWFRNSWTSLDSGQPSGWAVQSSVAPGYGRISYQYVKSWAHGQSIFEAPVVSWANRVTSFTNHASMRQAAFRVGMPLTVAMLLIAAGTTSFVKNAFGVKVSGIEAGRYQGGRERIASLEGRKGVMKKEIRRALARSEALEKLSEGEGKRRALEELAREVQSELRVNLDAWVGVDVEKDSKGLSSRQDVGESYGR